MAGKLPKSRVRGAAAARAAERAAARERIVQEAEARLTGRAKAVQELADKIRAEAAAAKVAGETARAAHDAELAGQSAAAAAGYQAAATGLEVATSRVITAQRDAGQSQLVVIQTAAGTPLTPAQTAFEEVRRAELQKLNVPPPAPPRPWDWLRRMMGFKEPPATAPGLAPTIGIEATHSLEGPSGIVVERKTIQVAHPAVVTAEEYASSIRDAGRLMHGSGWDTLSSAGIAQKAAATGAVPPGTIMQIGRGVEAPLAGAAARGRAEGRMPAPQVLGGGPAPVTPGGFFRFSGPADPTLPAFNILGGARVLSLRNVAVGSVAVVGIVLWVGKDWVFNLFIGQEEAGGGASMTSWLAGKSGDVATMKRTTEDMRRKAEVGKRTIALPVVGEVPELAVPVWGGLRAMEEFALTLDIQADFWGRELERAEAALVLEERAALIKERGPLVQVAHGAPGEVEILLVDKVPATSKDKPSLATYASGRPFGARLERRDGKPVWRVPLAEAVAWIAALRGKGFYVAVDAGAIDQIVPAPGTGEAIPTSEEPTPVAPSPGERPDVSVKPWFAPGFEPVQPADPHKPSLAPPD